MENSNQNDVVRFFEDMTDDLQNDGLMEGLSVDEVI